MLFIPAIPMVFMSLNDGAVALTVALISATMLTLAAWLLRRYSSRFFVVQAI